LDTVCAIGLANKLSCYKYAYNNNKYRFEFHSAFNIPTESKYNIKTIDLTETICGINKKNIGFCVSL